MSRIFTTKDEDGKNVVLKFTPPSQKILNQAELISRSAYSSAWRQGCLTVAEVKKQMKERGIWGDEQEDEVHKMRVKIAKLEKRLKDDTSLSNEEGEAICAEISKLRADIIEANDIHRSVTMNSCESISEEERNKFLTVSCITYSESGERVYKDVEDFMSRLGDQMAGDAFNETLVGLVEAQSGQKLPSDLSEEYVENKWRKDRKKLKEAEEAEETAEESEEEPKKKRARKKTS